MCSVCAEPPLLLVCVNADNEFCELARDSERFGVNLLEQRHDALAMVFAGLTGDGLPADRDMDRFRTGDWHVGENGSPILTDALVSLECRLDSSFERGTHRVFIGLVTAVRAPADGTPLIYTGRGFARPVAMR